MSLRPGLQAIASTARRAVAGFGKLLKDQGGNALMLTAAAMIPVVATIGGGLDLSRTYLVKARLHDACDAAALAGRRAMVNDDVTTAQPEALKFFNVNFPQNYLGSASVTPGVTVPESGVVQVTATTTVPTTLMMLFGYKTIPLDVSCDATQNFDNIDIVLVLDTTGSMAYTMGDKSNVGDSSSSSKMYGLRQAVMALYDQLQTAQDQLASEGLRLRYAIVPYSSAVNVGKLLYAQDPTYLATSWTYQSRVPNFTTTTSGGGGYGGYGSYGGGGGGSTTTTTFSNWTYEPVTYSLSSYESGGTLSAPVGSKGASVSLKWGGCVEERHTVSTITASSSTASVPSGADDLNIDEIPSSDATRWKPYLTDSHANGYTSAEFYRPTTSNYTTSSDYAGSTQKACPQQASRLQTMTRSAMQTYVNSLFSDGGTYHDLGMIWGARFLSPNGIFGADNPSVYNDRPVHRYIIYMTDGTLDTDKCVPVSSKCTSLYSGYGLEGIDGRVTGGSGSDPDGAHRTRFLMACNAAKQMGISIWTIVFAQKDDSTMETCASSSDQYSLSNSSDALIAKFKEIGKNIGALRLSV